MYKNGVIDPDRFKMLTVTLVAADNKKAIVRCDMKEDIPSYYIQVCQAGTIDKIARFICAPALRGYCFRHRYE